MLQLICVDSKLFTQPGLSLGWYDLHEIKSISLVEGQLTDVL